MNEKIVEESVERIESAVSEKDAHDGRQKPRLASMKLAALEELVVTLARKGESLSRIGMILRDQYGVPGARLLGKRISRILREHGIPYQTEKIIVEKRVARLRGHIEKHRHDYVAPRALTKRLWVLHAFEHSKR